MSSITSYLEKKRKNNNEIQNTLWIGAAEVSEKKYRNLPIAQLNNDDHFELHPVFLPDSIKSDFYHGFCNDCLWPLFHYFPSYAKFLQAHYDAYVKANELFLKAILKVYKPGDLIWIHDYHLMMLPEMLRKALPEANIGFFLHIPFPSFEIFRIMPSIWKKELLTGILGADLVGFHTGDYMHYFLRSVQQLLGFDVSGRKINSIDRIISTDVFPVSIDFNKFYRASDNPEIFEESNQIRKGLNGRQLVLSVDRLDYSKAIINRLESFAIFLEKYKQYWGKVTYMLLVVPSREIITKYKENKEDVERLISVINGKYGTLDWVPVSYQYKSIDFKRLTGLYFAADVALITPLRDGMNLVAKEFVSTRIDKRGVLILSETAGAAAELKEALIVNPSDREEIAQTILKALTMPFKEQASRNESMQTRIRNYDIVKWANDFIDQLENHNSFQTILGIKELTPTIEEKIIKEYQLAKKRLLLLDYDGTLTPFVRSPERAAPSIRLLELITRISLDERNTIVLVSGRKREDLENWFGNLPIGLVAEHGGYSRLPYKTWIQSKVVRFEWKKKVLEVLEYYTARCAGSFTEEKDLSLAWHYRETEKELGTIRSRELITELLSMAKELGFNVIEGHNVIEVRCPEINKGIGAKPWLENSKYDFILCAGDDNTDEDLFAVLRPNAYSIRIGFQQSYARFNCRSQQQFIRLFSKLIPEKIFA